MTLVHILYFVFYVRHRTVESSGFDGDLEHIMKDAAERQRMRESRRLGQLGNSLNQIRQQRFENDVIGIEHQDYHTKILISDHKLSLT